MTMKQIGDALLNAQKRGVTVRVISNHSMTHSSGSQINRLQEEGQLNWHVLWDLTKINQLNMHFLCK